ncbi:hypothetical protein H8B09_23275 [Paenibacillus sp. PR3]|uniref:Uncharacterized protein n=1 Tax=Paenibacillus terricola TaxID=2763503 RepID=A0ABR8N0I3_9BACL|nr:hypothetical protein [Paenibacillus terricola]MBD3921707.1 hypothetical protein [Paenibacillus terricola]
MSLKKGLFIAFMALIALLVGIVYLTPTVGDVLSNTRFEGYAKKAGIPISKKAPPLPKVTSEQIQIPVIQSSYCWSNLGCADYAGGKSQLQGVSPTPVNPGAAIKVSFSYKPKPNTLSIQQFGDEYKSTQIPFNNGSFIAPKEQGIYYYGISAYWTTADGKYSKGDTSSVFVIEVK